MEKQQKTPLEKYLDEKYPIMPKEIWDENNEYGNYDWYVKNIEGNRRIATEAYEFALQQPLPPTPELETLLNEKYPIETEDRYNSFYWKYDEDNYYSYKAKREELRETFTHGYLAGQSSLKQGRLTDSQINEVNEKLKHFTLYPKEHTEEEIKSLFTSIAFHFYELGKGQEREQGTPTDEEIEKAAKNYDINEDGEGNYDFVNGAKFVRDTYASKQDTKT